MKSEYRSEIWEKERVVMPLAVILILVLLLGLMALVVPGAKYDTFFGFGIFWCLLFVFCVGDYLHVMKKKRKYQNVVSNGQCYKGESCDYQVVKRMAGRKGFSRLHEWENFYIVHVKYFDSEVNGYRDVITPLMRFDLKNPDLMKMECNVYVLNGSPYVTDFKIREDYGKALENLKKFPDEGKFDVESYKVYKEVNDRDRFKKNEERERIERGRFILLCFIVGVIVFGLIEMISSLNGKI